MNTIIECNDITKTYKMQAKNGASNDVFMHALNNVSFTLNEGDRLGLVGLNGSGKSTLLKIIGGFIKPSCGSILIKKSVSSLSGFDSMLHPDLNAVENCKLQLQILGFKKDDLPSLIDEILIFSELTDFAFQPVKTFSSGMMLRLSFAIFSVTSPEILLLDEVFSAGDINFQRKVSLLMHQTFKNTPVIVMASHQLSEIQQYCNKCLILNKGEIQFFGTVLDALKFYQIQNKSVTKSLPENNILSIKKITSNKTVYKFGESIKIYVIYQKHVDKNIDLMINVRNAFGNILSDCIIYRQDYSAVYEKAGLYEIEAIIPNAILNTGLYYFDFDFGDGLNYISMVKDGLTIEVVPDVWEENKLWNLNPEYPIRVKMFWKKNEILNVN